MANATLKTRQAVGDIEVLIDSGPVPSKVRIPALIAGVFMLGIGIDILVNMLWGFWIVPYFMHDLGDLKVVVFLFTTIIGAFAVNACFSRRWVIFNPKAKQLVIETQWAAGIRSKPILITQITGITATRKRSGDREHWDLTVMDVEEKSYWLTRVHKQREAKDLSGLISNKINRKVSWR